VAERAAIGGRRATVAANANQGVAGLAGGELHRGEIRELGWSGCVAGHASHRGALVRMYSSICSSVHQGRLPRYPAGSGKVMVPSRVRRR